MKGLDFGQGTVKLKCWSRVHPFNSPREDGWIWREKIRVQIADSSLKEESVPVSGGKLYAWKPLTHWKGSTYSM